MKFNDVIICRCEEVTYSQLENTVKQYQCSSREAKLRTRAGMGYCGGRTCRHLIDLVVCQVNNEITPDQIPLKYQPPIRPITFGKLGDRT
ncbi:MULTISPECIES: (2Fe-2S)-binding protein [Bacillus]|uniref:(2Fe-2S)-binding protein n=1 Tax=Bacillus TaxID=1386 RepID=UPI0002F08F21|nr:MULTISPECIES: (2Fe-2S)-binding protein [Bacillus]